nr:MAG TPA: Major capsid protein [Microviridae sp.]
MAQNIFDATLDPNNEVKINNFDWQHANNFTTQIGTLTPIFCDLLPAHSEFRVNPRFALQFMPMVFPIQTRMKARMSWFRYPLRALWEDYRDFVGNFREGLEEPYINPTNVYAFQRMLTTGSLGDYLGIPTTMIGNYSNSCESSAYTTFNVSVGFISNDQNSQSVLQLMRNTIGSLSVVGGRYSYFQLNSSCPFGSNISGVTRVFSVPASQLKDGFTSLTSSVVLGNIDVSTDLVEYIINNLIVSIHVGSTGPNSIVKSVYSVLDGSLVVDEYSNDDSSVTIKYTIPVLDYGQVLDNEIMFMIFHIPKTVNPSDYSVMPDCSAFGAITSVTVASIDLGSSTQVVDVSTISQTPWYASNRSDVLSKDDLIKLSAYAFRAYEGIYNSYIRDNRNNPYYIDGRVEYNKWIPTNAGGADNNIYELHQVNWERDFLTTAVQSPQQGNAPLVGLTTYQTTRTAESGETVVENRVALVDETGKKFGIEFSSDEDGLTGVNYIELDNGTKVLQPRSLVDLPNSGISIADLRNVNAYQKFLELNMRKGYSYKDIVEGRFNVKVRYSDLLMPEYFGGVSRDVDVNSVTQTTDLNMAAGSSSYAGALGSQAGLAGVRGETSANIQTFCDEESIIMGLLYVTPLPVYTQLLPKHFTYRGLLDHYQPEFNHIGFQPILYKEVCPIQSFRDNPKSLFDTFGYNRPWYEYCQKYDQAHGEFRTTLNKFLMNRTFNSRPELSKSFLLVDPTQLNNVFSVTETTDKIYGQVWLDITVKLPIARVAIPRLD